MRFIAIYTDVAGYPNRREQLARLAAAHGGGFLAISPDDKDLGLPQIRLPDTWVPAAMPRAVADYWRAGYQWVRAIEQHALVADHFIGIEGDVGGDDAAWSALFGCTFDPQIDVACPFARNSPRGWGMFGALAVFTRRAIPWISAKAEETREMLHENSIPLSVAAAGGTIRDLRAITGPRLFSRLTLRYCQLNRPQPVPLLRPGMLSHPCKYDHPTGEPVNGGPGA